MTGKQSEKWLGLQWQQATTPADTREIYEWAAQEGELPSCYAVTGSFDWRFVPMVCEPFESLRRPRVREVIVMSAVQCLKTLIGELWLLWSVAESPGPTQWLQPTDEEAKEHAQERFLPLIENFPAVHRFYSENRHDKTTCFIKFRHMSMRMEGAGRGNVQRKSIKNQMRSEIWQQDKWPMGRLKEADSRLTQFVHNSKTYTESQPGHAAHMEVDDMHAAYLRGSQKVWNFACLSCGRYQPFYWSYLRNDGSRAAMRWETSERTRREDGQWRFSALQPTIRYECIYCGHAHTDDPITRRRMTATGKFISENPDAPSTVESYSWNQLAMQNLSWWETKIGGVRNYLAAYDQAKRGYNKPLIEFFQKVVGEPYDPDKHQAIDRMTTVEIQSEPGKPMIYQGIEFVHRLMAIDVQADHLWVLVEAWSSAGDSVTLYAEKVYTWEQASEIQSRFDVPHPNVCVDASHRNHEVICECARRGSKERQSGREYWACWKAMRGSDQDKFVWIPRTGKDRGSKIELPYTWPPQVGDPCLGLKSTDPRRKEFAGKLCQIITWSNPTIKDVVIRRRDGFAKGIKNLAVAGDWNEEFNRQMHSQKKVSVQGRLGGAKWRWEKFRDDHLLDCKCMITVRAFMLHLLGS